MCLVTGIVQLQGKRRAKVLGTPGLVAGIMQRNRVYSFLPHPVGSVANDPHRVAQYRRQLEHFSRLIYCRHGRTSNSEMMCYVVA